MNVYLAVIDTMADWEIGYLTAELHSRRFFRDPGMACNLIKLGVTRDAVHSMGGIQYMPEVTVDTVQIQADDLLLLPGGDVWDTPVVKPLLTLARCSRQGAQRCRHLRRDRWLGQDRCA